MDRKNDGDNSKFHFKTDRLIQQNGEWYYSTREGEEVGPFATKEEAEGDILLYIMAQKNQQEFGD